MYGYRHADAMKHAKNTLCLDILKDIQKDLLQNK
jgi:hypothetical protein